MEKTNIAYYVVNYPSLEAAKAGIVGKPLSVADEAPATVAMDFAWDGKKRYTKFDVFDIGRNPNRPLRPNADLDGAGAKIVPNLCVVCHAEQAVKFKAGRLGFTMAPPDGDTKARFIPFDLESFTYATAPGVEKAAFRKLNQGIYLYSCATTASASAPMISSVRKQRTTLG